MKLVKYIFIFTFIFQFNLNAQEVINTIEEIELEKIEPNSIMKYWLKMIDDGMSQPVCVPVIIAKGNNPSPVLGLIAALHGNELNGIKVIQDVIEKINVDSLNGTIIAIPGVNGISIPQHRRRFIDEEDLNRNFPGKEKGNRSQQYAWKINTKILSKIEYLVDMHTASFGRENTLYVRADLNDESIAQMASMQDADIILNNKGVPSTNEQIAATRTMRAEAMLKGIPAITIEYSNPQVYQPEIIKRGVRGIENLMGWLQMTNQKHSHSAAPTICKKSYWIYVEEGGYLEVTVDLNQKIKQGELIAIMRNPFGDILHKYYCPEDGIVIGKSSNPINMNGGRILHLGIIQTKEN